MITQAEIISALGVGSAFDVEEESRRRIEFLKDYMRVAGLGSYILGISGGIDSTTAGLLAQRAIRELRDEGRPATFVAVRLPYGVQADERDAQTAIAVIEPDQTFTINIKPAADAAWQQIISAGFTPSSSAQEDFLRGNVKARQRMIAQYALAGGLGGLVIGTDHAAEAVMGFFTKFGDGAADILPLAGLNKRRVRAIGRHLGAPEDLVLKVPTADLEDDVPLRPDEDAYGVSYEQIDDFLEGKDIDETARDRIMRAYSSTEHKRALPVAAISCV